MYCPAMAPCDFHFERLSFKEPIRALLIDDDQGDFVVTKALLS